MTETLDWVSVLNEEASWQTREDLLKWLDQHQKVSVNFQPDEGGNRGEEEIEEFEKALLYMRQQFEALHFGEKPNTEWLNERLFGMTFKVEADWHKGDLLPPFRSAFRDFGHSAQDSQPCLRALTETLLLQFAIFLSQAMRGSLPIIRCEGLYKLDDGEKGDSLSVVRSISDSAERKWRSELALISERHLEDDREIQRCADIVIPSRKAKYCSDACRYATFQIMKQLEDPDYLAEKQRRYRSRRG